MSRRNKKKPTVVTIDSSAESNDEEDTYVTVYKDNTGVEIPLDGESLSLKKLQLIYPQIEYLRIEGNEINRMLKPKNGFFVAPNCGWKAVKIIALLGQSTSNDATSHVSLKNVKTEQPSSTPFASVAVEQPQPEPSIAPTPFHLSNITAEPTRNIKEEKPSCPTNVPIEEAAAPIPRIPPPCLVNPPVLGHLRDQQTLYAPFVIQPQPVAASLLPNIPTPAEQSPVQNPIDIPVIPPSMNATERMSPISSSSDSPPDIAMEEVPMETEEKPTTSNRAPNQPLIELLEKTAFESSRFCGTNRSRSTNSRKRNSGGDASNDQSNSAPKRHKEVNEVQPSVRKRSTKSTSDIPLDESDSDGYEVVRTVRPIMGEFGDDQIGVTTDSTEQQLLFHFRVKSMSELERHKAMLLPHGIQNAAEFYHFREYAVHNLRSILISLKYLERPMYNLFMASKAEVLWREIDNRAPLMCRYCKENLSLRHILSKEHINLYRDKHSKDPPEIMAMLDERNQRFYMPDVSRSVLGEFRCQSFYVLKNFRQFQINRSYLHYEDKEKFKRSFFALRDTMIERFQKSPHLEVDRHYFSIDKMFYLKHEAIQNRDLVASLKDIFRIYPNKCEKCDADISSEMSYMKHLISKNHIRKDLSQLELNKISRAMKLLKLKQDDYEMVQLRRRHHDSSSNESEPPEDPMETDMATRR